MEPEIVFSGQLIGGLFSIIFVCLMLPVFYIIFYTVKKKLSLLTMGLGIVGFLVFGYALTGFLLGAVAPAESAAAAPGRYALLRALCVGVAEGGGAFLALWLLSRREDEITTPISYAVGYPLINMLVIGGANSFVRLGEAYTVNTRGLETVLASVEGEAVEQLRQELTALSQTAPYTYYLSAVDYICVFVLFAAVCRIEWYALHREGNTKFILLLAGVLLMAAAEAPVAFYQGGGTENFVLCEILHYAATLLCVALAILLERRYGEREKISAGPLNRRLL